MGERSRVLTVGLACLDIINVTDRYPAEDTDVRLKEQIWARGGNASNSAVILSQLGTPTWFLGTLARHTLSDLIVEDLQKYGVASELCRFHDNCVTPTSCVILNAAQGSRTILHANKTLPEASLEDFMKVNLDLYTWIHFEGRNVEQVLLMIERIEQYNSTQKDSSNPITVSVELEKPKIKADLQQLFNRGDVIFVSKDIAKSDGYESAEAAVKGYKSGVKRLCSIICAWGEQGACAIGPDDNIVSSPAFPPDKVVDTLGAGDTFNGAIIHSLNKGDSLQDAVSFGCKIAGKKCGQHGLDISR